MNGRDRIRREIIWTLDASEWGLPERLQGQLCDALMDVLEEIGTEQPDGSFLIIPHTQNGPESL